MKRKYLLALAAMLAFTSNAFAVNVIKLPLGSNSGADVVFDGTTFSTISDGNAATLGDQNTRILFDGFGGALANIETEIASFSLRDVLASGPAVTVAGVIAQGTTGGTFSLWAPDNTLLISGLLFDGALSGSGPGGTGSFFNTQLGTFTGGSLLSFLSGTTADIGLTLNAVTSAGLPGMHVTGSSLDPFQSDASAIIQGSAVPEPASVILLFSALAAAGVKRRQSLGAAEKLGELSQV